MDYTREQQQEADRVAQLVLSWHGEDKNALPTALQRIHNYYKSTREYTMYQDQMPYPHAVNRIMKAGGSVKGSRNNNLPI